LIDYGQVYGEVDMVDQQARIATIAGAVALVAVISYLRFCGSVSLPPKPPAPDGPTGTQTQLLAKSSASPVVYKGFLDADAASAGVRVPSVNDMAKKLAYRVDEARHVLEPGKPPLELAGVKIYLERASDQVILVVANQLDTTIAYNVTTTPSTGAATCTHVAPLAFNAMIMEKGGSQRRTECGWRDGMSIIVSKVETIEVSPLSAWYLSQLPPALVGIETRIARGHHGVEPKEKCTPVMSQVTRTGIDRGEIGWRDLVDFYARHRCQSYQFPSTYRALKSDGEIAIPAGTGTM
jgi:hypothetical protein